MFKQVIGVESRFAAFLIVVFSALAIGPVAQGDEATPNNAGNAAEAKQLAQSRQMVREVLNYWDFATWNQLLADNVVFNARLGTAAKDSAGEPALVGMNVEYKGRDDVKKALRDIYGDLRKDFRITTEIAHGPQVVLLGDLVVTQKGKDPATLPIAVSMTFNQAGKIERLGVFSIDVRAVSAALQTATSPTEKSTR